MKYVLSKARMILPTLLVVGLLFASAANAEKSKVLGQVELHGKTHVEKTSGVWVDGQYLGYLKEMKGKKALLLMPGEHEIVVRQNGYQDFVQRVTVEPGRKTDVEVAMSKGVSGVMPKETTEVKLTVTPDRAAVFVDGAFVGHVGEFEGLAHAMLVAPGPHNIRIALPGYESFETKIDAVAHQKVNIKTALLKSRSPETDPMLKPEAAPPPPSPGSGGAEPH
jgi:hypothetical protein